MKDWCRYLSMAVALVGTIGSMILAAVYGSPNESMSNWLPTVGIFAGCMAVTVIVATVLYALYETLLNLEAIVEIQDGYGEKIQDLDRMLQNRQKDAV